MIKSNTLLVVGAAASMDFGFPLGFQLKSEIARLLSLKMNNLGRLEASSSAQNALLISLSRRGEVDKSFGQGDVFEAAQIIASGVGLASSIDNFLEMRKESNLISLVAKAAIAHIILERERSCSALWGGKSSWTKPQPNYDDKWCQELAHILFERVGIEQLPEALARLNVVSFNYDRCVERFISIALQLLYSLPEAEAAKLAGCVNVLHPYGSLGPLPGVGDRNELAFGLDASIDPVYLSSRIRTFTEGAADGGVQDKIKEMVSNAKTIVFLGFGYHRQNIDILSPSAIVAKKKTVIGTAIKISDPARVDLEARLKAAFGSTVGAVFREPRLNLYNKDCRALLEENRHLLIE